MLIKPLGLSLGWMAVFLWCGLKRWQRLDVNVDLTEIVHCLPADTVLFSHAVNAPAVFELLSYFFAVRSEFKVPRFFAFLPSNAFMVFPCAFESCLGALGY